MEGRHNQNLEVPVDGVDDYTAAIELSNACREFYRNRVKATESFKQTMGNRNVPVDNAKKRTSIDDAMERLRNEMASLMDQDLSLMKQLLTLNEAIEDLKVKRMYHVSKDSLRASSQDLHASDWSVSETDMYDSDDELDKKMGDLEINDRLSTSSIPVPNTSSSRETTFGVSKDFAKSDIAIVVNGSPLKVRHGQQNSVDSGYGDDDSFNVTRMYKGPVEVDL